MDSMFQCLSCGLSLPESEVDSAGQVAPCPKCGRDMYRGRPPGSAAVPSRYGGSGTPAAGGGYGMARSAPALPSRYAGAAADTSRFEQEDDDDEANPMVLPHTPFVVILGLIFSFVPLLCFAGAIISFLGYRLVADSPKGVRGKEMSIAGMILGGLMSVLTVILIASNS